MTEYIVLTETNSYTIFAASIDDAEMLAQGVVSDGEYVVAVYPSGIPEIFT